MTHDPISAVSRSVIEHMNEDHAAANLDYARGLGGLTDATAASLIAIDSNGISLSVERPHGTQEISIAFPEKLQAAEEIRPALIKLLQAARGVLIKTTA